MYHIVTYKESGNVYLMKDVKNGLEILQCLQHHSDTPYSSEMILSLSHFAHLQENLYIEVVSGGDEILGLAAMEVL